MEKIRILYNNKKCPCCGKLYPANTDRKRCTCSHQGYLLIVGNWYRPKIGGVKFGTGKEFE